jgi:hypothetical protein
MCFLEGTKINTPNGYVEVEKLKIGDEVLTHSSGIKVITRVGSRSIVNLVNTPVNEKLYYYKKTEDDALVHNVIVGGKHSILVDELSEDEKISVERVLGSVKEVEGKFKLPVCLDKTSKVYPIRGKLNVYNFVLESSYPTEEYIIDASGKLVNSCSPISFTSHYR